MRVSGYKYALYTLLGHAKKMYLMYVMYVNVFDRTLLGWEGLALGGIVGVCVGV